MKTVILILKKELRQWKQQAASEKDYYKGYENDKMAKKDFARSKKHITELEQAIEKLK